MNEQALQAILEFLATAAKAQPTPAGRESYLTALLHLIQLYLQLLQIGAFK